MARKHQENVSSVQKFGMRCLVLCTLNLVAVVMVLVLIIVVVKYYSYITNTEKMVCLTTECIEMSATLLSRVDTHVSPCHNMYQYACGGWLEDVTEQDSPGLSLIEESIRHTEAIHKQILESESIELNGQNSTAMSKLKLYYKTCMDELTINALGPAPILQLISQMGSWTVTKHGLTPWDRHSWKLQTAVEHMHQMGTFVFFRINLMTDLQLNTSGAIMVILSRGNPSVSSTPYTNDQVVTNLYNAAFASAKFLSGDKKFNQAKLEEVIKLDLRLAELGRLSQMTSQSNDDSVLNIVNNEFTWIDFRHYLMTLLNVPEIPMTTVVWLESVSYFKQLETLIKNTDKEILANYITWSLIAEHKDFLPEVVWDSFLDLELSLSKHALAPRNRAEMCLKHAQLTWGAAISALVIEDYFSESNRARVIQVLVNVRKEFLTTLGVVDWLDDVIKKEVTKEVEAMKHSFVYEASVIDRQELDEFYENYTVIAGAFLESNVAISRMLCRKSVGLQWKPLRERRFTELMEVTQNLEALPDTYKYMTNNFVFTDTILHSPFFDPRFPKSILYGALGFTIGQMLVRSLEDNSPLHHTNQSLDVAMDTKAAEKLHNQVQCIIDQYNGYKVQDTFVNGSLTLLANIADNVGLQLAYRTYKHLANPKQASLPGLNLTGDQLFFLGFTQLWCASYSPMEELRQLKVSPYYIPQKYRAHGALSNNQDFATAFMCKVNETMNPVKKCTFI